MHGTADETRGPRPLNPFGDRSVSMGFARREHAGTVDAMPLVTELMRRMSRPVHARFKAGRRLEPAAVSATAADFERILDALAETVGRYDLDVPATRARPRSQYHEKSRLCVSRDASDFSLVFATLGVTAKRLHLEVSPTVLGWTRHAAERYYERAGDGTGASATIGRTLAAVLPLACHAIECVRDHKGFCDLAIPAGGGLLLGQVRETPEQDWAGRFIEFDVRGAVVGSRAHASIFQGPPAGIGHSAHWRAMTYVGPDEMRPDQEAYAEAWLDVVRRSGLMEDTGKGAQLVAMRKFAPEALAAFHRECVPLAGWMAAFLDDPRHAGIMRRTPYADPPPALPSSVQETRDLEVVLGKGFLNPGQAVPSADGWGAGRTAS